MSWEAQAWVWKQDLKAGPKWVLMGIANYVDQELKAWPSLETLGQRLGMTKQAVLSNMKILIEKGLVEKSRDHHYGVNTYRLKADVMVSKKVEKLMVNPTNAIKAIGKLEKSNQLKNLEKQVKKNELLQLKNLDSNPLIRIPISNPKNQPQGGDPSNQERKTEEEWRKVGDRLYQSDRQRFHKLIIWIRKAEQQYHPAIIRDALLEFESFESKGHKVDSWYPYLESIIKRIRVKRNVQQAESRHKELKMEEREWLRKIRENPTAAIVRLSADKKSG